MTQPQQFTRDDLDKIVVANVNEFGWHAVNVIEDDGHPPWTFSIGLYETWGFPELIVIGRSRATAHEMLKTLASQIEDGCTPDLRDPEPYLLLGMRSHFVEVNPRYYSDCV